MAPYIHMHWGKTFVVGMAAGAAMPGKLQHIAQDLALIQSMGVKVVLVHGFRPQVNERPVPRGVQRYSHGMRITDGVALDCAQEAAASCATRSRPPSARARPNTPMAGLPQARLRQLHHGAAGGHRRRHRFQHLALVRKVDVAGIKRTLDFGAMVLLSPSASRRPARPST